MLSILIPTYNYDVSPLVHNLYEMAVKENIAFEIIILDDASTTNFSPIDVNENVFYLKNETNLGRTFTRKKLAQTARYNMLLFLDADVLPASQDFIKNYTPYIYNNSQLVFGGYAYRKEDNLNTTGNLRLKYGICREQKLPSERKKNPYATILSGNLMIAKDVFIENNYSQNHNLYGMDIYFSYRLYKNNINVVHIDNPIYHVGLEDDAVFFKKSLQAVESRKQILANADGIENINGLLKHYKKLKAYGLAGITAFAFKLTEPLLKKMILKKNPNLFCLDIYRLGYICTLK